MADCKLPKWSAWSLPEELSSDEIGPPLRPDAGYITLTQAAYWIATEGGGRRFLVRDFSVWERAFDELLKRIQSGDVKVVGRRNGLGLPEKINGATFVGITVEYPYSDVRIDLMLGTRPYIKTAGAVFLDGSQDCPDELWCGSNMPKWSHLEVFCTHVKKFWPFPLYKTRVRVKIEKEAISILRAALIENQEMSRNEAKTIVGDTVGPRAFKDRVWPKAREQAGLDPIARAGAKRKRNRNA